MNKRLGMVLLVLVTGLLSAVGQEVIRVACVGNSITYGTGIKDREHDSYPMVLGRLLGKGYEVRNFGIAARTLMNKGDRPYMNEQIYRDALAYNPNIVTIKLGTNDTKPQNWQYNESFKDDLRELVRSFQDLPTHPAVYLCLPIPCRQPQWGINDSTIVAGVIPYIRQVAREMHLPVIDLHTAFLPYVHLLPDNVHPNKDGASLIAHVLCDRLLKDVRHDKRVTRQPRFFYNKKKDARSHKGNTASRNSRLSARRQR